MESNVNPSYYGELLKVLWRRGEIGPLPTIDGEVVVNSVGEYCDSSGRFIGAEVVIDGVVHRGEVLISIGQEAPTENHQNCILQVVPYPTSSIIKLDGEVLAQAVMKPDPVSIVAYESLREGSGNYGCGGHLARLAPHQRVTLFTRLLIDRLERKCGVVEQLFEECQNDWNQTMYMMLLRTMGDSRNKEAFTELSRRVSYVDISRERESVQYVEAMLMGASGLLEIYDDDSYTRNLKSTFNYLQKKYNIAPMRAGEWTLHKIRAANQPVLRMAQLAGFLTEREFIFDKMMQIKTMEDVYGYFRAEASTYWTEHSLPGKRSNENSYLKKVGRFKAEILAINLAVPMMFAYGREMNDEELKMKALELLEKINREDNSIVNGWHARGVVMESAFDSQAILQLNNEYCAKELCWKCTIGRKVIADVMR